ncbi:MAG: beta strand repeat-containing protein [Chthoniobacterales bacterium]
MPQVHAATISAAGNGLWSNPAIWSPATVPGSGDTAVINDNRTVDVNGSYTVDGLQLTAGGLGTGTTSGSGSLDVLGDFTMETDGWIGNAGGISLRGNSTLGSPIVAGSVYFYHNPTVQPVDNYGAVNLYTAAGAQQFGISEGSNTVHWTNHTGSSFTLNGTASIGSSSVSQFDNNAGATFTKTGAGTSTVNWSFINSGTLNVTDGKLLFNAPNSGGPSGAVQYSGSGNINVSPGATLAFNAVNFASGTSLSSRVTLEGTNFLEGSLNATNGTLAGTITGTNMTLSGEWTLNAGAAHVNATGTATLQGHVTAGSSTDSGSVSFYHNPGTMTVNNDADVDVLTTTGQHNGITEGSNPLNWNNRTGAIVTLHNGATLGSNSVSLFDNQAGATLTKVDNDTSTITWSFKNNGALNVQGGKLLFQQMTWKVGTGTIAVSPGAELEFSSVTFEDGASVDAPVTLTGASTLGGALTLSNATLAGLMTGANFTLSGNVTLAAGSSHLDTPGTATLNGNIIAGSTTDSGNVSFYHNPTAMTVANNAAIDVHSTAGQHSGITEGSNTLNWNNQTGSSVTLHDGSSLGSSAVSLFHNQAGATLTKVDSDTSTITWSVRNDGAINVQAGKLKFSQATWQVGTGSIAVSPGAELEFNTMTFADNSSVDAPITITGPTTISGSATFTNATVVDTIIGGNFSLHGNLTLNPGSGISTAGAVDLHGTVTAGSSTVSGSVFLYHNPDVMTVNNHAAVDVLTVPGQHNGLTEGSNTLIWNNLSGASVTLHDGATLGSSALSQFHNFTGATLTKSGAGKSTITWSVTNDGALGVQAGELLFDQVSYAGTGGITLGPGADLSFNAVDFAANSSIGVAATLTGFTMLHDGVTFGGAVIGNGATLAGAGHVTFASLDLTGGQLVADGGMLNVSGAVTGNGLVIGNVNLLDGLTPTGQAVIDQPVNVDGDIATFFSVGQAIIQSDADLGVGGQLHSDSGFQFSQTAELSGSGSLDGDVESTGTISPGNSPGKITFHDDLLLGPTSEFVFQLGGTTPVTQYDVVDVDGLLTAAGKLTVNLINGFSPAVGDAFDILDWNSLAGTFAVVELPAGVDWNTDQLYTTGTIVAVPEPATWMLAGIAGAVVLLLRRRRI